MEQMTAELHCHNVFSNFHQDDGDTPYDCNVTMEDQLSRAAMLGLDVLFVTNHNTLDGYHQMRQLQKDHSRYGQVRVFPAEEITTCEGTHVIAYGIHEEIKPGKSFEETVDEIRMQDAVSAAPHPFGLLDSVREKARFCDLVEVFNSNNVDALANARASLFADECGLTGVSGSDSHVLSTLGRCTNVLESEVNLDDILHSMRHGMISIKASGYATAREMLEHFRYKVDNSTEYIFDYISEIYPGSRWLFAALLRLFERSPNSYLWVLLYQMGLFAAKRISKKINFGGLDPAFMRERNLTDILRAAL